MFQQMINQLCPPEPAPAQRQPRSRGRDPEVSRYAAWLYRHGHTWREIMQATGLSYGTLRRSLDDMGVVRTRR